MHEFIGNETDTNRFQADVKLFTDWFKHSRYKLQSKLEFFYVSFMEDPTIKNRVIKNIQKRRADYIEQEFPETV